MKKLIVTLEYPPQIGGIATFVYNLASHLQNDTVVIWAPKMKGDEDFDIKNDWKTYRSQPYFWFIWPQWLRLLWQVNKIVKKEKIERIFLHHVLPVGYIAYIIKKIKKIPYTVFLHGTDLELGSKFKKNKLFKVCQFSDEIIVNSEFMRHKLIEKLPKLNAEKIKIIYPCPGDVFFQDIILENVKKLKSQLALDGKKVIICVGRMLDGKGFTQLIKILPDILKKIPNAVCVLIGDGPKKNFLFDFVQKNNLQNAVRFLGNIPYEELPKYYRVGDLFVLLTHKDKNTEEAWGTVFLEAAACGLPVIGGRAGGTDEAVDDGVTGLMVDTADQINVINIITSLLIDTETSQTMGAAGRERVAHDFTWNKQIEKL